MFLEELFVLGRAVGVRGDQGGPALPPPPTFWLLNFFIINDKKKKLKNLQF